MNTIKRRTVVINLLDETGAPKMTWTLNNAWPTKITGTDLKSDGNEVAVEAVGDRLRDADRGRTVSEAATMANDYYPLGSVLFQRQGARSRHGRFAGRESGHRRLRLNLDRYRCQLPGSDGHRVSV